VSKRKKSVQDYILEMVSRIVSRFHPDKIILFGSHARGDAGPDSDVDLLVVMAVEGSRRERSVEIGVVLHDIPLAKDIVVVTPSDIEKRQDIPGTLIRPALQEGKVLYARTA
jgi:uncharacterized protein